MCGQEAMRTEHEVLALMTGEFMNRFISYR